MSGARQQPERPRPALTLEAMRLEALRLAHRHDREPFQIIETAKQYLAWVQNGDEPGRD